MNLDKKRWHDLKFLLHTILSDQFLILNQNEYQNQPEQEEMTSGMLDELVGSVVHKSTTNVGHAGQR